MNRLLTTMRWDIALQVRNGFYYATAFVVAMWALIFLQLPALNIAWFLPCLVAGNLLMNTFYFISGLVLLEKGEGTLSALVVTPLRIGEYLTAKIGTLTLLATLENVLIVGLLYGFGFRAVPLVLGIVLVSAFYVLTGFVAVARYDSINQYLFPSVIYSSLVSLPLLPYLAQWDHWLLYVHPLQGLLVLLQAAFEPVAAWKLVFGVLYAAFWIGIVYRWSRRAFTRFILVGSGGS